MTDCAICFSEVTAATGRTVMSCGHEYHMRCLFQWLQKPDGSGNCPCCRREPTEHERLVAAPVDEDSEYDSDSDDESESEAEDVTPLMTAISDGNMAEVTRLIAEGANLEERDSDGDTALVYAVMQTTTETLRLLLDAGANIDSRGLGGTTPLMRALEERQDEIAKLLIERGASCSAEDQDGESIVIQAARIDAGDILQMVLERGVGRLDEALHTACAAGSLDCVRALLEAGVDPNVPQGEHRVTPLMAAVAGENPAGIVEALLAKGANVHATDTHGWNVFMWMTEAEEVPDSEIMAALLDAQSHWSRDASGRWFHILNSWGLADAAPPPYTLAEKLRSAATCIQAAWRGYQGRQRRSVRVDGWARIQVTFPVPIAPPPTSAMKPVSVPAWWEQRFSRVL